MPSALSAAARRAGWIALAVGAGCARAPAGSSAATPEPPSVPPAAAAASAPEPGASVAARPPYTGVAGALSAFIEHEMRTKQLPAVSIALVDGRRIVFARGFGMARPADSIPATAETVHRVGSVSKLFTDIGIMRLVERGVLDLDAPVTRYLPDFRPKSGSASTITLRQLMAHRSGLVREPPVGNYFDTTAPPLAATVASLNATSLVYPPNSRTKYSNAAIATVGYVLERTQREPFARWLDREVLAPLGMRRSSFAPIPALTADLAAAEMWTYDGRRFAAPTFELGMAPAGSMYSTVTDLGRFLAALFAIHHGTDGVLSRAALQEMWRPQFAPEGARTGFGLGFAVGTLDGRRRIGHGGAIYGFATELAALPDDSLGVVVVATLDGANAVTDRIADAALRLMLAARRGIPLPVPETTRRLPPGAAGRLDGRYRSRSAGAMLAARGDSLYLTRDRGGFRLSLGAPIGAAPLPTPLIADDRLDFGTRVVPLPGARIAIGGDTLARMPAARPAPAPARWAPLIGEYGWDHNTMYLLEDGESLRALIEWFFEYPLEEVAADTFAFPRYGLYDGERIIVQRDRAGRVTGVEAASVVFPRREVGTTHGTTFRITPRRPVESLRREALAATPPAERGDFRRSELVELTSLDSTIRLDIRYATTNNFMSAVFYSEPRAFLQRPAAEALVRAHRALARHGYGLLIHDAYRPWYVTKMFWEATPDSQRIFVADPARGSRHNRGAAVDLTLYDRTTGMPVEMVGGYDEFSPRSYPDYPGGTSLQRWHRELLRDAMEAEGFRVYENEWWHFDHGEWRRYPISNLRFDQIR